ncbi:MAG: MBL fold metallo-hydrolase [Candidatus Saccharicenans sp.]
MKIIFLGTGGSRPTARRDNTGLLLDFNRAGVLVDCPGSLPARLEKVGYQAGQVSDIFLTHIHPDHVYGLPLLIHAWREREQPLRLFGSAETIEFCLKLLRLFNLDRERIWPNLQLIQLSEGQSTNVSPEVEVRAFRVKHHSSSLAFLFAGYGKKIFIAGDTALDRQLLSQVSSLSVLVHDCSFPSTVARNFPALQKKHTNSFELGEAAGEIKPGLLIAVHFLSELGFSLSEVEKEIRASYDGPLLLPEDFQVVEID